MNLILWRHAEAEDQASSDLARQLTSRGRKQAQGMAKWLRARIGDDAIFLASPATRTIQTAEAFGDRYRVVDDLAPGKTAKNVLDAAGWPDGAGQTVVVIGHQPTLGRVAALLLTGHEAEWPVKKSGIWWFQGRTRSGDGQIVVRAVMCPDLL
ncbi:histidine phosphatase family protein [Caballeronia sp. LZ062]|uniref:SixA phosphatase family protein n=1 Tax=unclassified Caballeronia TaxID=2646786 RepID=UPI002858AAFC|nr:MULTISPECIES: histidine phosphatase family protein [unclassified Caballeronia]MDR5854956.1 histidine phosphatase family protein [Caballeronia sp. LZ050]MDR5870515.1 histidine phosphatase family protein [Caballeronia sp. LZ062]